MNVLRYDPGDFVYVEIPTKLRCILRLSCNWDGKAEVYFTHIFSVSLKPTAEGIQPVLTPMSDTLELERDGVIAFSKEDTVIASRITKGSEMYGELLRQTTSVILGGTTIPLGPARPTIS